MDHVTFHHDTVLSDVHMLIPNTRHLMTRLNTAGQPVFVSKFRILSDGDRTVDQRETLREGESPVTPTESRPSPGQVDSLLDEDGDLDVTHRPRRESSESIRELVCPVILQRSDPADAHEEEEEEGYDDDDSDEDKCLKDVIRIEHTMSTPLDDVGKQVWRGAFLLADFVLSDPIIFSGSSVLELGAGTGFTSIVMATTAKTVYCTDVGDDLLNMCERNVKLNKHLVEPTGEVKVRRLDWLQSDICTDVEEDFRWTDEEINELYENTRFVIAADVCYDDDLTDGFFKTLYKLCSTFSHTINIYIALEKRFNFTLRHLDVSCEAYDHFRRHLSELQDMKDGRCRFTVSKLQTDFKQSLIYERVQQLELWRLTSAPLHIDTTSDPQQTPP